MKMIFSMNGTKKNTLDLKKKPLQIPNPISIPNGNFSMFQRINYGNKCSACGK